MLHSPAPGFCQLQWHSNSLTGWHLPCATLSSRRSFSMPVGHELARHRRHRLASKCLSMLESQAPCPRAGADRRGPGELRTEKACVAGGLQGPTATGFAQRVGVQPALLQAGGVLTGAHSSDAPRGTAPLRVASRQLQSATRTVSVLCRACSTATLGRRLCGAK